jgi:hypothetical protein
MKFNDHNCNGENNLGDEGLANWTIFIDYNLDNVFKNPGEPYTTTGAQGYYSFTVPPGSYRIREVNQSGWTQSLPDAPPYHYQTVVAYQSVSGLDFGNCCGEPCPNNIVENWSFTPDFVPWIVAYGSPDTGSSSTAWCDLGKVCMWGNKVAGEAIYQTPLASPFAKDWCYAIKFDAVWLPFPGRPYPVQFEFRASNQPLTGPGLPPGVARIGVSAPVTPAQTWMSMPTIKWKATDDYSILTVSATNQSSYPHGDSTSYGAIDRICIYKFMLGDANGDGVIDISDVVYLLNYLFINGPAPVPLAAGDANCDGVVDASDLVYLLNYLFAHGPAPGC